jgi:hypothetical protein
VVISRKKGKVCAEYKEYRGEWFEDCKPTSEELRE